MADFAFIGDEAECVAFGLRFPRGVGVAVLNAHAVRKLSNNRFFAEVLTVDAVEVFDAAPTHDAPKRRGRPPKARP